MKNFKILIKSSFAIILAFMMLFCVACRPAPDNTPQTPPEDLGPNSLSFHKQSLSLTIGAKETNIAFVFRTVEGQVLTYTSADENIATVDEFSGEVEAINAGQTKIIANYGELSAEYPVYVTYLGNIVPSIVTNENSDFNLVKDSTYKFDPKINYNNLIFNDGHFTYETDNNEVIEINEDGSFTAIKSGEAKVIIKADWRGFQYNQYPVLSKEFNVKVIEDVNIQVAGVNSDFVQVYTRNEFAGKTYNTDVSFVPTATVGDTVKETGISVQIADPTIAKYENNKIVGLKYGTTFANVKYDDGNQVEVERQYKIFVERPTAKYGTTVNYFSSEKGTLRNENESFADMTLAQFIYGTTNTPTIIDASVNGQELKVSNNRVYGITGPSDSTYEVTVSVGTDTEIYDVDMHVYGMYIYSLEDLTSAFVVTEKESESCLYVELANDLDAKDITLTKHFNDNETSIKVPTISNSYKEAEGFKGTFDGKGHTIKNLKTAKYGLMCDITGATIKNIAFENVTIAGAGFFAENILDSNFENIYIKVADMPLDPNNGILAGNVFAANPVVLGSFKNIFVDAQAVAKISDMLTGAFVTIANRANATAPIFESCLILSDLPMGVSMHMYHDSSNKPVLNSSWLQIALAENVNSNQNEQKEMMNYVWENLAFESVREDCKTIFQGSNPGAEISSAVINSLGRVHGVAGVRSYKTVSNVKEDTNSVAFLKSFMNYDEYWSQIDGMLIWGDVQLNAKPGQIYLSVGEAFGQQVEGFSSNPVIPMIGQAVQLPKLECYGLVFKGWKDYETGIFYEATAGLNYVQVVDSYNGKAMDFVAIWEVDDNVSVGDDLPF